MLAKNQLQLGATEYTSGMASSDYALDGGLGTSCSGLNPFVQPGVMYPLSTGSDLSTNISGSIIASCEDSQSISAYTRTFVDSSGNYYTYDGTNIVKTNTATTNAAGYTSGKTDMVAFGGYTYVTTTKGTGVNDGDIDRWNTSGTPSLTNSWWITTKGKTGMAGNVPHPMVVFQKLLWVADRNNLYSIDESGTIVTTNNVFLNSNEIIYALCIDPATGLMMVSVQSTVNYSNILNSTYFVYLWNGASLTATRKIQVNDLITAFYPLGGTVYVGYGQTLGQWNGSGVSFLRFLKNVTLSGSDLPYKHHFSNTRNILHIIDGDDVLSYGEVTAGKKGFFYTAYNPTGTGHLSHIMNLGQNKIGVAYATNKLTSYDFSSTSAGALSLYFNDVYFPRPIWIRRIRVITTGMSTTSSAGIGSMTVYDENTTGITTTPNTFINLTGSTKYVFDFDFEIKLQRFLPRILMDTQGVGIIRVYAYYDVAE